MTSPAPQATTLWPSGAFAAALSPSPGLGGIMAAPGLLTGGAPSLSAALPTEGPSSLLSTLLPVPGPLARKPAFVTSTWGTSQLVRGRPSPSSPSAALPAAHAHPSMARGRSSLLSIGMDTPAPLQPRAWP